MKRCLVLFAVILTSLLSVATYADPYTAYTELKKSNYELALKGFQESANQGDASSMYNLGMMYQQGLGVKVDYDKALSLYQKALHHGFHKAAIAIGFVYVLKGHSKENLEKALAWFKKGIQLGERYYGSLNAGVMLQKLHREHEAFKYFLMAANAGSTYGQYQVGLAYLHGKVVKQDIKQAYVWLSRAKAGGNQDASIALSAMLARLSPAQIEQLQAFSS